MNSLSQLQNNFLKAILDEQQTTPSQVLPNRQLDADQRMKLYRDAYRLRLIDALSDSFPVLHALAGDELFESIALGYIAAHPSQHFSIRYFGHQLKDFLAEQDEFKDIPVLSEMAAFEWQLRDAFDGPDAAPLQRNDLTSYRLEQWPHLIFELVPTFSVIQLQWNVPQLWKSISDDEEPPAPQPSSQATDWIIWRPQLLTLFRSIDSTEKFALNQLQKQSNFTQLCESLQNSGTPEPETIVAGLLNRWIEDGLLATVWINQD